MNHIWDFQEGPRARHTDRETSHAAAASIKQDSITEMKSRILLGLKSPRTDEELVRFFEEWNWEGSPSGIRSRRNELEKAGLVRAVGQSKTASGRRCNVFQVVP